jgi:hypothetical protein
MAKVQKFWKLPASFTAYPRLFGLVKWVSYLIIVPNHTAEAFIFCQVEFIIVTTQV